MVVVKLSDITDTMKRNSEKPEVIKSSDLTKAIENQENQDKTKKSGCLKVHIEIECNDQKGRKIKVTADACSKEELEQIHSRYGGYMPRKKWLGIF